MPRNGRESSDLDVARRALDREAAGIVALRDSLDARFTAAVGVLAEVAEHNGRVIVSGMGKSGHVGRKIAATLASMGTPATFVHPAEASHGDLGMITKVDALIALSNSGETGELDDLLAYAKRMMLKVIAVTGEAGSSLAEAADVALVLPPAEEACPNGLAPTTSTTMMMALGDALAAALVERRGFSADQFKALHPGGKLGRRLLHVGDLMHRGDEVPVVAPATPMSDVLIVMTQKRFGCVGVVGDDGTLAGVVTDGDLRRHMSDNLLKERAGDVMTRTPQTIRAHALAAEALALMNARRITSLFVVDGAHPIGIVHIHDCLRAGVT